jgi:uncharacterized membrane protein (UPF0136 family)
MIAFRRRKEGTGWARRAVFLLAYSRDEINAAEMWEVVAMLNPVVGEVALGVYALLLAVGGVMGYAKARSKASAIAGTLSAAIAGMSILIMAGGNPWGERLGLLLAISLLIYFGNKYLKTRKFMPSGMLAVVSLVVAGILAAVIA